MIKKPEERQQLIDLVILYLSYRNSITFGPQGYKFWRKMIIYITGLGDANLIRSVFNTLIQESVFQVEGRGKKYARVKYVFNPNERISNIEIKEIVRKRKPLGTVCFD